MSARIHQPRISGIGAFSSASGTKNYASETPLVEHFIVIAAVDLCPFVWDRLRAKREAQAAVSPTNFGPSDVSEQEQLLVSSSGFGVHDSGCGKSILGAETLHEFEQMWKQRGIASPDSFAMAMGHPDG